MFFLKIWFEFGFLLFLVIYVLFYIVDFTREETNQASSIELIVIPDTNIDDIGVNVGGELHICCTDDLIAEQVCNEAFKDKLIIKDNIEGISREDIVFDENEGTKKVSFRTDVEITKIHVFAMASCKNGLGTVTFEGSSIWMNPYGHLPGDVYGYLPFYGWMCILYLGVAVVWFFFNAMYWKQLLYVQVKAHINILKLRSDAKILSIFF